MELEFSLLNYDFIIYKVTVVLRLVIITSNYNSHFHNNSLLIIPGAVPISIRRIRAR